MLACTVVCLRKMDKSYTLYVEDVQLVNGKVLKNPIKMAFQTVDVAFTSEHKIEQDVLKQKILPNETTIQKNEKVCAKIKVTNASEKSRVLTKVLMAVRPRN